VTSFAEHQHLTAARLESVPSEMLQPVWKTILPGLRKIERRNASHWIAEDVYAAIRNGQSHLYLAKRGDYYAGFVILTMLQGWDGLALHIWCAYSTGGYDPLSEFIPEIEKVARQAKARRITFLSNRAWDRDKRIFNHGFKVNQVEYMKEL
jgi:hypothetical protein